MPALVLPRTAEEISPSIFVRVMELPCVFSSKLSLLHGLTKQHTVGSHSETCGDHRKQNVAVRIWGNSTNTFGTDCSVHRYAVALASRQATPDSLSGDFQIDMSCRLEVRGSGVMRFLFYVPVSWQGDLEVLKSPRTATPGFNTRDGEDDGGTMRMKLKIVLLQLSVFRYSLLLFN